MISETHAMRFCSEPISKIENYQDAVNDREHMWHCHHRAEVLPCGIYSREALKRAGMYWHRPASELIFLTDNEHKSLHGSNRSTNTKRKMSESHKGRYFSDEVRRKISESLKGKVVSRSTRLKMSRPVKMIRICDGCEMTFQSLRDAEIWLRDNNFPLASQANITRCCRGRRKSTYGARWEYANELV